MREKITKMQEKDKYIVNERLKFCNANMQTTAHETIKESLGIKSPQENVITIKNRL